MLHLTLEVEATSSSLIHEMVSMAVLAMLCQATLVCILARSRSHHLEAVCRVQSRSLRALSNVTCVVGMWSKDGMIVVLDSDC